MKKLLPFTILFLFSYLSQAQCESYSYYINEACYNANDLVRLAESMEEIGQKACKKDTLEKAKKLIAHFMSLAESAEEEAKDSSFGAYQAKSEAESCECDHGESHADDIVELGDDAASVANEAYQYAWRASKAETLEEFKKQASEALQTARQLIWDARYVSDEADSAAKHCQSGC